MYVSVSIYIPKDQTVYEEYQMLCPVIRRMCGQIFSLLIFLYLTGHSAITIVS